jgi:tRNA/tmRNA/rRNA uracil-C5-methylase (TrmA/RlmC/RlmD family)
MTPRAPGDLIELDITGVAHGGVLVARDEGRVVFTADAIPGERVLARVTEAKKSFLRADTVRVLQPSPDRRAHVWAEAGLDRAPEDRAGGAEFGHIALARQRELKEEVLTDAMHRQGGLDVAVPVEAVDGDDDRDGLGWRTRVTLHVDGDGVVGPYARGSHRVIPVRGLPLAVPELDVPASLLPRPGRDGGVRLVSTTGSGIRVVENGDAGAETVVESVGGRSFRLAAGGFWQVHRAAAATLTAATAGAVDAALFDPEAANLDLYGGVGLLAAAVADRFGAARITTVEADATASAHAAENLAEWPGAAAVRARVDTHLDRLRRDGSRRERERMAAATVVLDPPRSGAGREVVEALAALGPAQLVYVACEPVALARDAGLLAAAGYVMRDLRAFDLFPHTHHLEAVARFTR